MSEAARAPAAGARRRGSDARVDHLPGFVLHTYPWRETSLIVEALTRDHGRVALVARGAKRGTSQLRGLLSPFSALALGWSGRGEVKTLSVQIAVVGRDQQDRIGGQRRLDDVAQVAID